MTADNPGADRGQREQVARAIWEATNGEGSHLAWDDKRVSDLYRNRYRLYADAALAAARPDDGAAAALGRVLAVLDALTTTCAESEGDGFRAVIDARVVAAQLSKALDPQ